MSSCQYGGTGSTINQSFMSRNFFDFKDDKLNKLKIVMKYLDAVDKVQGAAFYHDESQKIMQLPWVRYLDISASTKKRLSG